MAGAEYKKYGSQKMVKMVEGVISNVDLNITKQSRKKLYVIVDYKILMEVSTVVAGPV